jgi:DNA-binding transcriptional LysR family regulator
MTDLHSVLTLPPLLRALERHAPGVRLQAEPISLPDLTERITDGEIDLALGFLLSPPERIRSETLFVDEYVCLVRRGHKLARRKRLTLADYGEHQHLSNTPVSFVPRTMADSRYGFGAREGIRASLPYLLALPAIVRSTDLVATAPRRTARGARVVRRRGGHRRPARAAKGGALHLVAPALRRRPGAHVLARAAARGGGSAGLPRSVEHVLLGT